MHDYNCKGCSQCRLGMIFCSCGRPAERTNEKCIACDNGHDILHLHLLDGTWYIRFEGARRAEILDLFGTDVLPTSFTALSSADTVLAAIKALNTDSIVVLN
jgi:hypothetical protein